MEPRIQIEDRFHNAALSVCQRWRCLDFRSSDQGFNDAADALKSDIETRGGVEAARLFLRSESPSEVFVELSTRHRLDLTLEALCLRPAWSVLFSVQQRGIAAKRLTDMLALDSSGARVPPSGDDLASTAAWLNEQLVSWEHDTSLPRKLVWRTEFEGLVSSKERGWCECISDCARELEEVGCLRASIGMCSHYRTCAACAARWPRIDSFLCRFEERCRALLNTLVVCLDRVGIPPVWRALDPVELDALAWRAIICASGIEYFVDLDPDTVSGWRPSLIGNEVFALHFADAVRYLFMEIQWGLFDQDGPIYLATDGDLSTIPGILYLLPSTDFGEWKSLMTGCDLAFEQPSRSTYLDCYGLFVILARAAAFERNIHQTGPRRSPDESPAVQRAPNLEDRLSELTDAVDSIRAGQMPVIDALEKLVRRMDGPSRIRAEETLRETLGPETYSGLCPAARNAAIVAEYCWLDANFPDPSKVVVDLATAFERQLRDDILTSFCKTLVESRARNYPEFDGVSRGDAFSTPGLPLPGRPRLPVLLRQGQMNRKLNLGDMRLLITQPELSAFLNKRGLNAGRLAELLQEVAGKRNNAQHEGGLSKEEAEAIRRRWLGLDDPASNIFAAVIGNALRAEPGT